ncbi:MAG: alcohol dehydrogenase catalytic domain-containing protein, partial [Planctomycetales bacterium]|nr:alcohol dehydrogenase catalytic domain-containing protein [Planctomycetales bacterium]
MRAVLFDEFGGQLRVGEVADPSPAVDGVVVEVHAAGVCRSDWHGWQGHDADIAVLPHVPGHELAGVVCAVGNDVRRWRIGDRVTIPFVAGCGECAECVAGAPQVCPEQYQPG